MSWYIHMNGTEITSPSLEMDEESEKHFFLEDDYNPNAMPANGQDIYEFSASFSNRNAILSLFCGIQITNNWLKMHGGIMSRKKRRRS